MGVIVRPRCSTPASAAPSSSAGATLPAASRAARPHPDHDPRAGQTGRHATRAATNARSITATGNVMTVTSPDPRPQSASGQLADDAGQPSLLEWQARLRASAGFRAFALQNQVKRMGYLLQGNVAQYRSLVARLQDPSVFFP